MPEAYNPATISSGDLLNLSGVYRREYVGFTNAPSYMSFCFSSPFRIGKTRHAAGVRFTDDRIGFFVNQMLHLQYAYMYDVWGGVLSIGADIGYVDIEFLADSVNLDEFSDTYHSAEDIAIPEGSSTSGMKFDLGFGIYFVTNNWYTGISFEHLTYPVIEWSDNSVFHLRGMMYAMGGYDWAIPRSRWILKPSAMLVTDLSDWSGDVNVMAQYRGRYSAGLGYRLLSGVNFLLGLEVVSGLKIAYSYELPTSKLLRVSSGSHEVYLSYGFEILRPRRTNRYKSIRYL